TPTDMDQITPPAPPADLPRPEAYSPPPAPRAPRPTFSWAPMLQMRQRRWWTIALAATLVVTAGGVRILYVDDTANQAAVRSLTLQKESLDGRNQILKDQVKATDANLTAMLAEL